MNRFLIIGVVEIVFGLLAVLGLLLVIELLHSSPGEIAGALASIIAGVLALIAGVVAYQGAMQAAKIQVKAVDTQTKTLREQNAELKRENRCKLARDGIIATQLILGVVNKLKDDGKRLQALLEQPQYKVPGVWAPSDWRKLVAKPPLAVVWNDVGLCGREVIEKYLALDSKIDEFVTRDINGPDYIRDRIAEIERIIDFLNDELSGEAKRCFAVLAEGV